MGKLSHPEGRVIISVDMQYKNYHTFQDGTKITLVRQVNNFDRKYTEPVNAIVISGSRLPVGAEVLVHPNSTHDTNRIFNHAQISGKDIASEINLYSIREEDCYLWRKNTMEWTPCDGYDTALRVFRPHRGIIIGIEPKKIPDTLFVTSGKYRGKVVKTMRACDYELIFNDLDGRECRVIRFRPDGNYASDNPAHHREAEAIAIMNEMTRQVKNGELYIGLTKNDCKSIKQIPHA